MPIPERLQITKATPKLVARMCELCDQIERELESGEDALPLLAEWHRHARRQCEPYEFANYWRSTDQVQFVREALSPPPSFLDDLKYADALAVLESIMKAELVEWQTSYYLCWLEEQFPEANMSDLIFWPDEWFGDPSLFRDEAGRFKPEAELSSDQVLAYAMAKSGRSLPDRPDSVSLPFPMPG
ncbi:hypothetical protein [Bremerella sp.]|uniref:hypothetical protein n=1 Tax=Bremerella sp. TaxID=2795602 RepID=UPI0039193383